MIYEEQSDYNDSDIFANQRDQLNFEREGFWGAIPDFFSQVAEKTTETGQSIFQGLTNMMGSNENVEKTDQNGQNCQGGQHSHASIIKKFMGDGYHRRHSEQITRRTVNAFRHEAGRPGIVDRLHIRKFFKI